MRLMSKERVFGNLNAWIKRSDLRLLLIRS